jgi:Cu(I)/Ag(I) efflux system periplasmic protein CusF
MKPWHSLFFTGTMLVAATAATVVPVAAADPHAGHGKPAVQGAAVAMSDGTVRKIDTATGRITIAHGPLANLGMPPMTMVFKAKDAALLKDLKVGDGIRFVAEQEGNDYVVSRLQRKP